MSICKPEVNKIKVAVCQVPDIREDVIASLTWIKKFAKQAADENVSLICFPECFLQGYLTEKQTAEKYALNFTSVAFKNILLQLEVYKPMLVIGIIEEENKQLFNTAVVIKQGILIGKYRKTHLLKGEKIFTTGIEYPIFEIDGLKFGINICYDTQFAQAAAAIGIHGASLILCPANNMMRYQTANEYKQLHNLVRIERAKENRVWLLSADVTGEREDRISYGPTAAINPEGKVVAQVPLMQTGMITVEISS